MFDVLGKQALANESLFYLDKINVISEEVGCCKDGGLPPTS